MRANFSTKVKYIKTKIKDLKSGDILLKHSCRSCLCKLEDSRVIEKDGKEFRKATKIFDCKEHEQSEKHLLIYFIDTEYAVVLKG